MEGIFEQFSTCDVEDVGMLHEKGVPNVGLCAFQLFYSPCQMHVTTRTNMPILTSNFIFPNREGLERLRKFFSLSQVHTMKVK
jgi:hypothetical protein